MTSTLISRRLDTSLQQQQPGLNFQFFDDQDLLRSLDCPVFLLISHNKQLVCRREKGHGESSSTCQSDDEDVSGGGFLSDSESSDSDSDSAPDGPSGFPGHTGKRILAKERLATL